MAVDRNSKEFQEKVYKYKKIKIIVERKDVVYEMDVDHLKLR